MKENINLQAFLIKYNSFYIFELNFSIKLTSFRDQISHQCVMLRILRIFLCVVISNLNDDKAMLLMLAASFITM